MTWILAAFLAIALNGPAIQESQDTPISARRLYNGVERPAEIIISDVEGDGALSLVLLDAFGNMPLTPVTVNPGVIDLSEIMPQIWQTRAAVFLQLMQDGQAIGSPLIVQPIWNRQPIWVKQDVRWNGNPYTRVVGWGTEPPEGWNETLQDQDAPGEDTIDSEPVEDDDAAPKQPAPPTPEIEESVFSGLRMYVEHDAVLKTSKGDIRIAFAPEEAPNTVYNFLHLVEGGYYSDIIFHRIVPLERNGWPFVIQAGDPSGTGIGGPGYWLPLEPSYLPHDFGVISMARGDDPDSAGGQFFICLSREGTARLDGQYCAFGFAVGSESAHTIRNIADVRLVDVEAGKPLDPPVIYEARLVPAPPRIEGKSRADDRSTIEDLENDTPAKSDRIDR